MHNTVEARTITFTIDSNAYGILKKIPEVHRNSFIHLAIMDAVGSEFYKKLVAPSEEVLSKVNELSSFDNNKQGDKSGNSVSSASSNTSWDNF